MASRTLLLVRHGQEERTPQVSPLGNGLSPLGREQARLTARHLARVEVSAIYWSTMPRAAETAAAIAAEHPGVPVAGTRQLHEGIGIIPRAFEHYLADLDKMTVERDRQRMERVFNRFFRPARRPRTEILVAHGNLINYLIARSLNAPPESWVRMEMYNCGISTVIVEPQPAPERGMVLQAHNETGHLPPSLRTLF